jgi:hypothetical protein
LQPSKHLSVGLTQVTIIASAQLHLATTVTLFKHSIHQTTLLMSKSLNLPYLKLSTSCVCLLLASLNSTAANWSYMMPQSIKRSIWQSDICHPYPSQHKSSTRLVLSFAPSPVKLRNLGNISSPAGLPFKSRLRLSKLLPWLFQSTIYQQTSRINQISPVRSDSKKRPQS